MNLLDTIAAISTPYGKGGIAVLRVSGEDACNVADKVFSAKNGKKLADISGAKAIYGYIFEGTEENRRQIDDGIAVFSVRQTHLRARTRLRYHVTAEF